MEKMKINFSLMRRGGGMGGCISELKGILIIHFFLVTASLVYWVTCTYVCMYDLQPDRLGLEFWLGSK